jgi:FtsH-binding integral membrane protein
VPQKKTRNLAKQVLAVQQAELMNAFQAGVLNAKNHPPAIIERFLFLLLSVGALLSGYSMAVQKQEDWFLTFVYVLLMGFTLYVIFALEFPNEIQNLDFLNADLIRAQTSIKN